MILKKMKLASEQYQSLDSQLSPVRYHWITAVPNAKSKYLFTKLYKAKKGEDKETKVISDFCFLSMRTLLACHHPSV